MVCICTQHHRKCHFHSGAIHRQRAPFTAFGFSRHLKAIMADAKAKAEALVPKFQLLRVLNHGKRMYLFHSGHINAIQMIMP